MARKPFLTGHYYHIWNRGRSRLPICHDARDYECITAKLIQYSQKLSISVIAYALLPNHYHFLVRQDNTARATLLPQRIFNSYSKVYNLKYAHSGTLFEGRPGCKPVDTPPYLLHLCRYIHANPIKHGLTRCLDAWPYTNLDEWLSRRCSPLVDRSFIDHYFPSPTTYKAFVEEIIPRYLKRRNTLQNRNPRFHN